MISGLTDLVEDVERQEPDVGAIVSQVGISPQMFCHDFGEDSS